MANNKDIIKNIRTPYISTTDMAKYLGVSRVAVFKKIKSGKIKAEKIGRNYLISKEELLSVIGEFVPADRRRDIDSTLNKIVRDYGNALKRLGDE